MRDKTVLIIIDGYGISNSFKGNAIKQAQTPNIEAFSKECIINTTLSASGSSVGLPDKVIGNSEVGHLTIGSGRVIDTDIVRINKVMTDSLSYFLPLTTYKNTPSKNLHICGLISDSSVHSNINHLFKILDFVLETNYKTSEGSKSYYDLDSRNKICLHLITDGRDSPPKSGLNYLQSILKYIEEKQVSSIVSIVSLGGRFYYMDRDKREERTQAAFLAMKNEFSLNEIKRQDEDKYIHFQDFKKLLTKTETRNEEKNKFHTVLTPEEYLKSSYEFTSDEFILPYNFLNSIKEYQDFAFSEDDDIFFFNFRADRMKQIVSSFSNLESKTSMEKSTVPKIFTMTDFGVTDPNSKISVLFPIREIRNPLASLLPTIKIAETEKYAHVTYFFNGRKEQPEPFERRILVPSNKSVQTYDLAPEMSMKEVAQEVVKAIDNEDNTKTNIQNEEKTGILIVCNLAGPDMVGHTGNLKATVKAVETCDECIGEIVKKSKDWNVVITADHGNAEVMGEFGGITSHSTNKVPFLVKTVRKDLVLNNIENGGLENVAPTILEIMNLECKEMTGISLLKKNG